MDFRIVDIHGNTMGYIVNSPSMIVAHLEAIKTYPDYKKLVLIEIFKVPLSIVNKVLRPRELLYYIEESKWCLN
jgi:hypothetical protein